MTTKNTASANYHLRLVTFNTWHGLDHTSYYLMLPAENPLRQYRRKAATVQLLANLPKPTEAHSLEVFMLQELNPVSRVEKKIGKKLGMQSAGFAVNTGARLGRFSYPLFLEEGLGTYWTDSLIRSRSEGKFLSGWGLDYKLPFGISAGIHFGERRGALMTQGLWEGQKCCFVNVHLHAGPAVFASARRLEEIERLLEWVNASAKDADLIFLAGDFNSATAHPEIQKILDAGYESLCQQNGEDTPTWDPITNSLCEKSMSLDPDPVWREWDKTVKALDHVFVMQKGKKIKWKASVQRIGDTPQEGMWLSDHFGLIVDLTWKKAEKKTTDGADSE